MRRLALLLLPLAAGANAADKRLYLSSFDRLRVEGPYRVVVTAGRSPGGSLTGDARALERVEVRQDGNVVVVRDPTIAEQGRAATPPGDVTVTLATPTLASVQVIGPGEVAAAGLKGPRAALSVAGTGSLRVTGTDVVDLYAANIGDGRVSIAGRAGKAHLTVNGAGRIVADALDAGEVTVRLDGPGEVAARARFTADVNTSGLGQVTVAGSPKCSVHAVAGAVTCGAAAVRP